MNAKRILLAIFALSFSLPLVLGVSAGAQVPLPKPQPVPLMQVVPLPYHQVSFQRQGTEIARYHFGPNLHRPFVFPMVGPSGRSLTRMGHPRDPESHSHHNSVWISHHDINGVNFWSDRGTGRIVHQRVERLDEAPETASILTLNAWSSNTGKVLLQERRQILVQSLARNEWILTIDLQLENNDEEVKLGKTPFGLIGVRMAKTIGVNDGGGTIRNSEGGLNEAGVLWKRARWVDYSGPVTAEGLEGITLMDHPSNPNHPTFFHVRNDGWMGSSLTYEGPRTIPAGKPLRLRYCLYVHSGTPPPELLQERWDEFARTRPPDLSAKPK